MYYRGVKMTDDGGYSGANEVTCYAESRDGIHWEKPELGLYEFEGSKKNNIIIPPNAERRVSHNFAAYLDDRPGVPKEERYKGIGGTRHHGLTRMISADGIHWKRYPGEPLFQGYALDTHNILVYSPEEEVYAIYIRTWSGGGTPEQPKFRGYRTISRSVSKDFKTWSKPEPMTFDGRQEHLYTNGTISYFRAPHLLLGFPFRFMPNVQVLSEATMDNLGVHETQRRGISDAVMMSSRGGTHYNRTFMEALVRPGPGVEGWTARNNMPALGVVPTGEREIPMYIGKAYTHNNYHLRRYSLRTDGFASLHGSYDGGFAETRQLSFDGDVLTLNASTSAAGRILIEVLDRNGEPIPGYTIHDADPIIGDDLNLIASWNGNADLGILEGVPIQLRFHLKDADIFSLQFRDKNEQEITEILGK